MMDKPHFLVVDDDEVDTEVVRRAFCATESDVQLDTARNGVEALAFLRDPMVRHPVTVLLDLNMPLMGGLEMLDEVRDDESLHRHRIFVLTTSADDRDLVESYERQIAGYIVKPVTFDKAKDVARVLSELWEFNRFPPSKPSK